MIIRVLTAWSGSPACGVVADVDDAIAAARINSGDAELVGVQVVVSADAQAMSVIEAAVDQASVETAIAPAARPRGRKGSR